MSHRAHPTFDDPLDAILWDSCPSCQSHASVMGLNLDGPNFRRMWERMVAVEYGPDRYRTDMEAMLGHKLYMISVLLERHGDGIDPLTLKGR